MQHSPPRQPKLLNEWQGKSLLRDFGIAVPEGQLCASSEAPSVAQQIGFPITLKLVNADLPHKTEHGVVRLNLQTPEAVSQAAQGVLQNGENALGSPVPDELLVEEMVTEVVAELLVGIKNDPAFGLMMTIASGGTLVELLADSSTVILPAERADFYAAISKLKIMKLLQGFRGQANVDIDTLLDTLIRTAQMAHALRDRLRGDGHQPAHGHAHAMHRGRRTDSPWRISLASLPGRKRPADYDKDNASASGLRRGDRGFCRAGSRTDRYLLRRE